jgi:hypothetical protein
MPAEPGPVDAEPGSTPPHTGLGGNEKQSLFPPMPKVSAKITPNMVSETINRGLGSFQIEFPSLRPKRNNFRVSARGNRPAGKSAQNPRFAYPATRPCCPLGQPDTLCKCLIYRNFSILEKQIPSPRRCPQHKCGPIACSNWTALAEIRLQTHLLRTGLAADSLRGRSASFADAKAGLRPEVRLERTYSVWRGALPPLRSLGAQLSLH